MHDNHKKLLSPHGAQYTISMFRFVFTSCLISLIALSAGSAWAQQKIAHFNDWRVFTAKQNGDTLCYVASLPTSHSGNFSKRGEPYFLVTHKTSQTDEISTASGYPYKDKSSVALTIGKKKFSLFTQKDTAWAKDAAEDKKIVQELMLGKTMKIRGTSEIGTFSEDSYSLKGFKAAYQRMKKACKKP